MDSASADIEDEEHVDPSQQHRVGGEDVTRQHGCRLGTAELPPRRTGAPRSRIQTRVAQDVEHCRRRHPVTQPDQFAVDTAMTPACVFPREPGHEVVTDDVRGPRATPRLFSSSAGRSSAERPAAGANAATSAELRSAHAWVFWAASATAPQVPADLLAPAEDGSPADATPPRRGAAPAGQHPCCLAATARHDEREQHSDDRI